MSTITEDYVSFETAKLLKKKGFDEQTVRCYNLKKELCACQCIGDETINSTPNYLIAAPTLQMAMKWLRKKHNLHITTIPYAPMDKHPYHPGEADVIYIAQLFKGIIPIDEIGRSIIKLTPEEACETAIKYTLENLI